MISSNVSKIFKITGYKGIFKITGYKGDITSIEVEKIKSTGFIEVKVAEVTDPLSGNREIGVEKKVTKLSIPLEVATALFEVLGELLGLKVEMPTGNLGIIPRTDEMPTGNYGFRSNDPKSPHYHPHG
jgi:hypothetical protein